MKINNKQKIFDNKKILCYHKLQQIEKTLIERVLIL